MKKLLLTFLILLFSLPSFAGRYDSLEIKIQNLADGRSFYYVNGLPVTTKTYESYKSGEIGPRKLIDTAHNDKKARAEGFSSWDEMLTEKKKVKISSNDRDAVVADMIKKKKIVDANKKRHAENAELKRKEAEKKKAEEKKKTADKKKAVEIKRLNNIKIDAIIREAEIKSKINPGFRDLKPGMPSIEYYKICNDNYCYGLNAFKFLPEFRTQYTGPEGRVSMGSQGVKLLNSLIIDMGIITSDGLFLDMFNEDSLYLKMKKTFDSKYVLDYGYSDRDRQLFNEGMKDALLRVYSNGQVTLIITHKKREGSYSTDLWLYVEYRDVEWGKQFLDSNRPVNVNLDDF